MVAFPGIVPGLFAWKGGKNEPIFNIPNNHSNLTDSICRGDYHMLNHILRGLLVHPQTITTGSAEGTGEGEGGASRTHPQVDKGRAYQAYTLRGLRPSFIFLLCVYTKYNIHYTAHSPFY